MEEGAFSKVAAARLTNPEKEQTRLEKQLKALRKVKPSVNASRIDFMLMKMRRQSGELNPDYLNRLLQTFVERVDLADDTFSITYSLTKKSAVPTGTADLAPVKLSRSIEIESCSTGA